MYKIIISKNETELRKEEEILELDFADFETARTYYESTRKGLNYNCSISMFQFKGEVIKLISEQKFSSLKLDFTKVYDI